jgi:hypothetical protein
MNYQRISQALISTRKLYTTPSFLRQPQKEHPLIEHANKLEHETRTRGNYSQEIASSRPLSQARQDKIDDDKKRMQWRIPISSQPGAPQTKLEVFRMDHEKEPSALRMAVYPIDLSIDGIKRSIAKHKVKKERYLQQFIPERHEILGCDLAAAHFLIFRGGKVKFVGHREWTVQSKENPEIIPLPINYDPRYEVEAIDCENMTLYYEGLENIRRLRKLKYLSFKNVKLFDDWGLDRVSGSDFTILETLDISGTSVTANGFSALYRMPQLKTLIIDEQPEENIAWHLTISMVKDILPHLEIVNQPKN